MGLDAGMPDFDGDIGQAQDDADDSRILKDKRVKNSRLRARAARTCGSNCGSMRYTDHRTAITTIPNTISRLSIMPFAYHAPERPPHVQQIGMRLRVFVF